MYGKYIAENTENIYAIHILCNVKQISAKNGWSRDWCSDTGTCPILAGLDMGTQTHGGAAGKKMVQNFLNKCGITVTKIFPPVSLSQYI